MRDDGHAASSGVAVVVSGGQHETVTGAVRAMSPSPSPPLRRRRPRRAAALLLPLVLHGCFTMALWGFDSEDEEDPFTGETETTYVYDPDTEWSWENFGLRVLLTPFTLALDCLTCPIQACLCACDDGDEAPRHDHCRR